MVPDKFNMVDMGGVDLIMAQGEEVPGLYNRLVESITLCHYQCLYNWFFDGIVIPPTYVIMEVNENDEVTINKGVTVTDDDVIHIYSLEIPILPTIIPLSTDENGVWNAPEGVDGYNPVSVAVYPELEQGRTFTSNGTYTSDMYGFGTVNVSVPAAPKKQLFEVQVEVEVGVSFVS